MHQGFQFQLTTIKITQRSGIHRNMEGRGRGHNIPRVRRRKTPNRSTTTGHCFTTSYKLPRSGIMRHNFRGDESPTLRLACQIQVIEDVSVTKRTEFWGQRDSVAQVSEAVTYFRDLEYALDRKSLHWYQREKTAARSNSIRVYRLKA